MSEGLDIFLRLGVAMLVGACLGLNRDMHRKPTGVRTLGLVGLATALAVVSARDAGIAISAISPVIQGALTGIGFLGAGVIVRDETAKVHGLTTAAAVWLTACLGLACGLGAWRPVIVSLVLIVPLLMFGRRIEKAARPRDEPGLGAVAETERDA